MMHFGRMGRPAPTYTCYVGFFFKRCSSSTVDHASFREEEGSNGAPMVGIEADTFFDYCPVLHLACGGGGEGCGAVKRDPEV